MKRLLLSGISLLALLVGAPRYGAACTVPVTDSGATLIFDINACLAASVSSGTVNVGSANQLAYYPASSAAVSGVTVSGDASFTGSSWSNTGLHFGSSDIQTTATPPTSGQCLGYNGVGFTGFACAGGSGSGTVISGTGPGMAQYPAGTGTAVNAVTISGDASVAQGGAWSNTGLHFGSTDIQTTSTAPTSGQCLEYNGTGITGAACSGGSGTGTVNVGTGPAIAQYPAGSGTAVSPVSVSGDCTIAQGGKFTCTATNGVPFGTVATLSVGSGLTASAGFLNVSNPTYCGPTNLTGSNTVTFSTSCPRQLSTATANETALSFSELRTGCSSTNRCPETWDWCQDATGGHTLAVATAVHWSNNASAPDYPTTAAGAGANCQEYYLYYNGTYFIQTGETPPFAGP